MGTETYPMRTAQEKRHAYLTRYSRLKVDRSSWDYHWSDLSRHILPRSARFFYSDRNRGGKHRYNAIYDNTATRSVRVLSAGLMAGMTSPARPWFRLTSGDPEDRYSHDVQLWLDEVVRRMQVVFNKSNIYRALQHTYDELGVFGTSCQLILSDFDTVIRSYPLTVGEYCLQQDYQGRIVAVYREYSRTVGELVKEFGLKNCSNHVQQAFQNRQLENDITVLHVVEPRRDQTRNPDVPNRDMPWVSVHLEIGGDSDNILRESGFRRMRVLAPRWQVYGSDVYGTSPGMEALGDIRQLQQQQFRKSQAIDYKVKPPLQVPQSVKDRMRDMLPGGVSFFEPGMTLPYDQVTPQGGIRTAFTVDLQLDHLLIDIQDVRTRIRSAFYEDLFLMFAAGDVGDRMTVPEVLERQGEKLLMVGPVIERMTNELLEPLIDITFQEMLEVGALPPPPEELLGQELSIEFISVLAQAQRAVGINTTQQWMNDMLVVAQSRPDVLDNANMDEWARHSASVRGVPAKLLTDPRSVEMLRQARAEAEAAAEQTALAQTQAKATKDLAEAPVGGGSALDELIGTTP